MTVVALRDFTFKGKVVQKGESVEMPPIQVAIHGRVGNVDLFPRPTYRTRDLNAAPVGAMTTDEQHVSPSVPPKRRGRPRKKVLA